MLALHLSTSSWYFSSFLSKASSKFSSQGTVSSSIMTCLETVDQTNKSGRRDDVVICTGIFNWFPRSTLNCQSRADASMQVDDLRTVEDFSPALMKQIAFVSGLQLQSLIAVATISANFFSHVSTGTSLHQVLLGKRLRYVSAYFSWNRVGMMVTRSSPKYASLQDSVVHRTRIAQGI